MKPEDRVKKRIAVLFNCVNLSEVSRRTGYAKQTLRNWKNNPTMIRAVDLERLEDLLGKGAIIK